jgi:hypothetical protein
MSEPPRDNEGIVTPHDDPETIPDDGLLVRFIHLTHFLQNKDGVDQLSSAAFSETNKQNDKYQSMSVDILSRFEEYQIDPKSRLRPNQAGAVLLSAGRLRKLGLIVGPDPLEENPCHAGVWGIADKPKSIRRKIKKCCCTWLIQPRNAKPIEIG